MMPKSLLVTLIALLLAVHTGFGCAPLLYYGIKETRAYEYDRRVPISVDTEPVGAHSHDCGWDSTWEGADPCL